MLFCAPVQLSSSDTQKISAARLLMSIWCRVKRTSGESRLCIFSRGYFRSAPAKLQLLIKGQTRGQLHTKHTKLDAIIWILTAGNLHCVYGRACDGRKNSSVAFAWIMMQQNLWAYMCGLFTPTVFCCFRQHLREVAFTAQQSYWIEDAGICT